MVVASAAVLVHELPLSAGVQGEEAATVVAFAALPAAPSPSS